MTFTKEDIERLVPEATEARGHDWFQYLLTTRRQLEIAMEALKAIERIGDNDPDCNHCGEYLDAREIARKAIAKAEGRE